MTGPEDSDELEDGGYDPEAFERRRAAVKETTLPRVPVTRVEPSEPPEATAWLASCDAPINAEFSLFVKSLGPKPKVTSGPIGKRRQVELKQWEYNWALGRLELDRALSAIFSAVPPEVLELPGARYHLQGRADRRRHLIGQSEKLVAERAAALEQAKDALHSDEAPKRRGRAIAMASVKLGYIKLIAAVEKEQQRHDSARATKEEDARHAAACAQFEVKWAALDALKQTLA